MLLIRRSWMSIGTRARLLQRLTVQSTWLRRDRCSDCSCVRFVKYNFVIRSRPSHPIFRAFYAVKNRKYVHMARLIVESQQLLMIGAPHNSRALWITVSCASLYYLPGCGYLLWCPWCLYGESGGWWAGYVILTTEPAAPTTWDDSGVPNLTKKLSTLVPSFFHVLNLATLMGFTKD